MKKYLSLISLILFVATSCSNNECRITVTLPNNANNGKLVYLEELSMDGRSLKNIDSTTVTDNTFKFNVKADSLCVRFLTIENIEGDLTNNVLVFIEKGDVQVNMDTLNIVSGTPTNERYRKFVREDHQLDMKSSNYYQILEDKSKLRFEFAKEIIQKPAGEFIFASFLPMLEPSQILELIKLSRPEFQEREEVKMIKKQAEYFASPEAQEMM